MFRLFWTELNTLGALYTHSTELCILCVCSINCKTCVFVVSDWTANNRMYACHWLAGWLALFLSLSVLLCLSAAQQIILSLPHTLYVYHRWCMCECVSLSLGIFLFVFYSFCHRSAEFAVVVVVITIIQQIGGKVHIHKALSELSKIQFITACWSEHKHTGETQKIFEPELIFLAAFLVIAALDIVYVILWEIFEKKKRKDFGAYFYYNSYGEEKPIKRKNPYTIQNWLTPGSFVKKLFTDKLNACFFWK